jgi:hypothetical protein
MSVGEFEVCGAIKPTGSLDDPRDDRANLLWVFCIGVHQEKSQMPALRCLISAAANAIK